MKSCLIRCISKRRKSENRSLCDSALSCPVSPFLLPLNSVMFVLLLMVPVLLFPSTLEASSKGFSRFLSFPLGYDVEVIYLYYVTKCTVKGLPALVK